MTAPLSIAANDTTEPQSSLSARIIAEPARLRAEIEALIDRAFGPGRYAKAAERLREGNAMRADLSFCAMAAGVVVGTVRQWPVMVGAARGVFLGPIAVEGGWRKHGVGGALIDVACAAAGAADERFILLVGDVPLFGLHGFEVVPAGRVVMPGPVDGRRILWRALREDGLNDVAGEAHIPAHDR